MEEFEDAYADSWPETVTKAEAMREVLLHQGSWRGFIDDLGDRDEYKSRDVLIWLGY